MNKTIEVDLDEFLHCITQSLGYASLINYPKIISQLTASEHFKKSYLFDEERCPTDLYTTDAWILEVQRRKEISNTSANFPKEYKAPKSLLDQIIEAKESGDMVRLKQIMEQLITK